MEADFEFWKPEIQTERKSNQIVLHFICGEIRFSPTIDLFARRINTQLRTPISDGPDPNYIAVNALLINSEKEKFYTFPPFVCLSKTLLKIYQDKAKGIPFYPRLIETFLLNYFYSSQKIKLVSTKPTFNASPISQKTITASLLSRWGNNALTKDVKDVIINSWAEKTRNQYRTYFSQQKKFCQDCNFSLTNASISEGLEFLLVLQKKIQLLSHQNCKENAIHDTTSM